MNQLIQALIHWFLESEQYKIYIYKYLHKLFSYDTRRLQNFINMIYFIAGDLDFDYPLDLL
jgi:hypothetical protein